MRLKAAIVSVLVLVFVFSANGRSAPQSTSGYELYSWKRSGHWYYSLLPRSTAPKTYSQITAKSNVRRDSSGLTSELKKLQRGDQVFWMADAPSSLQRPASDTIDFKHPSRQRIKSIKSICERLGLKLQLSNQAQ